MGGDAVTFGSGCEEDNDDSKNSDSTLNLFLIFTIKLLVRNKLQIKTKPLKNTINLITQSQQPSSYISPILNRNNPIPKPQQSHPQIKIIPLPNRNEFHPKIATIPN